MAKAKLKHPKPGTAAELAAVRYKAAKQLCEQSLHFFVREAWHVLEPDSEFVDNCHIAAICEHLEAVTDGRVSNLLVNVPPGTMKSMLCSVFWPAWVWATKPSKRFMYSSYAEPLALRDSVKTRDLVCSEWYQQRWGVELKEDQNAKGRFDTAAGGWRVVGSISGKGVGEHPHFNVSDDPHNVLNAESELDRQKVTHWFEGVFMVRGVILGVRRVLVMQRLHALDCSGVALDKGGWTHLCFPMRYEQPEKQQDGSYKPRMATTPLGFNDPRKEEGDLLWPRIYSAETVANQEVNMGTYGAAGQLQQRPAPRGGGTFKRDGFEVLRTAPPLAKIVRYWDKAATRGGTGARSAGVLMAMYIDPLAPLPAFKNKYIVLDVRGDRWSASEREAAIKQTAAEDQSVYGYVETWVEQEPGSGGKESAEGTQANLGGFTVKIERVTGAKEVRAEPFATASSVGKVKLLAGAWNNSFLDELALFPVGKLKDQVDAAGGAYNKLHVATGALDIRTARTGKADFGERLETSRLSANDF